LTARRLEPGGREAIERDIRKGITRGKPLLRRGAIATKKSELSTLSSKSIEVTRKMEIKILPAEETPLVSVKFAKSDFGEGEGNRKLRAEKKIVDVRKKGGGRNPPKGTGD